MKLNTTLLIISILGLAFLSACGEDDGSDSGTETATGALDGQWLVTEFTCDGESMPIGEFTLVVDGESGQFIQAFGPECVAVLEETYSYPDDSTFSIEPTSVACTPSSGCPDVFMGAECLPLAPATSFAWSMDGDELTFTRTAEGPGDAPCSPGQAVEFKMTRQ